MQHSFPDRGITSFGDSNTSAYSYYNPANLTVDGPKERARRYQQRYTPSGSVSPSIPQSLDHPPSTLSSTSGASGQSKASSTAGSPYSLATHSLPSQDAWSESNHGLGIAPDTLHNDAFTHNAFPSGGLEGELCYQDGKFPDNFVGEYGTFPSVLCSQTCSTFATALNSECISTFPGSPFIQSPRNHIGRSAMSKQPPGSLILPSTALAISEHNVAEGSSYQSSSLAMSTLGNQAAISPIISEIDSSSSDTFKPPVKPASTTCRTLPQSSPSRQHTSRWQTHDCQPANHFFNQSNGRFIAPLESSCRFSLL